MTYDNLIILSFISLLIFINAQYDDDDKDLPQEMYQSVRSSKSSFDAQFQRGQCPDRFYQIGDECLYFATDGKRYSWHQAQRVCVRRVGRSLERQTSLVISQTNIKPTKGVRQLILNTPEKTKILQSLFREYDELNFAVRLLSDYNTLRRCDDGKEDYWPQYCVKPENLNATCFETSELGSNNICLRQIDCSKRNFRLACEFTLPGNSELSESKFRHCPKIHGLRHRLSIWAWLLIVVGAMLLLLLILGGVLAFRRNAKKGSSEIKSIDPERRHTGEQAINVSSSREDLATEPMLVRAAASNGSDTNYLQSQPLKRVAPSTIPTAKIIKHDDKTPKI